MRHGTDRINKGTLTWLCLSCPAKYTHTHGRFAMRSVTYKYFILMRTNCSTETQSAIYNLKGEELNIYQILRAASVKPNLKLQIRLCCVFKSWTSSDFVSKVRSLLNNYLHICLTCGLTNSKVLFSSRFYRGPKILSEVKVHHVTWSIPMWSSSSC